MRNQIFLVFDSLRWDVFRNAKTPFLDSLGDWKQAYTQGTYTFPAHMSFFVGKLPQTYSDENYYDTVSTRFKEGKRSRNIPLWNLSNPESPRPSVHKIHGKNIVEDFREKGFMTIGSGAMNWFNPEVPAGRYLTEPFEHFRFFTNEYGSSHECADYQIKWALETINSSDRPYFLFLNFGETHHKFQYRGCSWYEQGDPYGDHQECIRRQTRCIEYLDRQVRALFENLNPSTCDIVITADHGEALGEDGLWGHGFCHQKVMEVPLLIRKAKDIGKKTDGATTKFPRIRTSAYTEDPPSKQNKFLAFCWGNEALIKYFKAFSLDIKTKLGTDFVVVSDTLQGKKLLEEEGLTSFAIEELVPLAIRRYPEKIAAEMVKDITKIDRIRSREPFLYGRIGKFINTMRDGDIHSTAVQNILACYRYLIDKIAPDAVFTWNGALLIQKGLPLLASKAGIPSYYMERGLLPGTLFIDPQGVNYSSSLSGCNWKNHSPEILSDGLRKELNNFRDKFSAQGVTIVSAGKKMSGKEIRGLLGLSSDEMLLLFPLQIETDTNIITHSPVYKRMPDIVKDLGLYLKKHDKVRIVVKAHPEDPKDWLQEMSAICDDKIVFSSDINLIPLLDAADGVITVNSTVGFESLMRGKPVLCLGNAIYSGKGFTFDLCCRENFGQVFSDFLLAVREGYFEQEAFLVFLNHMLKHSLFDINRQDRWGGNANIAKQIQRRCRMKSEAIIHVEKKYYSRSCKHTWKL